MRVTVIGAGILGLGCAWEIQQSGHEVTVISTGVGELQSAGASRIFRLFHESPTMIDAAAQARDRWLAWEKEFGVQLLQPVGLAVHGQQNPDPQRFYPLNGHPLTIGTDGWLVDDKAGCSLIGEAINQLHSRVTTQIGTVREIDGSRVWLTNGECIDADCIVGCAGIQNPILSKTEPQPLLQTVRASFDIRGDPPVPPCMIWRANEEDDLTPPHYGLLDGDRYALGISTDGDGDDEGYGERTLEQIVQLVQTRFPTLHPTPHNIIQCQYRADEEGDQEWDWHETDGNLWISGSRLCKFAPLLSHNAAMWINGNL